MSTSDKTEFSRNLSSGQTLVVNLREDGNADINILFDKGESSVLTQRVRIEEMIPSVAAIARELAAQTCREVAYAYRLGEEVHYRKVSPAGRVDTITERSISRFHAYLRPL